MQGKGAVVVISSHVAAGHVGNRAMVFALERLGFEVWAVPTVILPRHPGHGRVERIVPEPQAFALLLDQLIESGRAKHVRAILTGYFAGAGQIDTAARLVLAVREARPDAVYLCDPVIGDAGGLYIGEALAALVRDTLLPLADVATPNAFECRWLAGAREDADLREAGRRLPVPTLLVTSAPALMRGHVGNLLLDGGQATLFEHRRAKTTAKGTGDLLSALFLARLLMSLRASEAAESAISSIAEIVQATAHAGSAELLLTECQEALAQPRAAISARRLAPAK